MNCKDVEKQLLEFHFGLSEDRKSIEDHLLECRSCLESFLETKRAVEMGEDGPAPSKTARMRLRQAVRDELHPKPRRWAWWERPAAFALAASIVLIAGAAMKKMTSGPGSPPYAMQSR